MMSTKQRVAVCLFVFMFLQSHAMHADCLCDFLVTPRGATFLAITGGVIGTVCNTAWALDWNRHFNISDINHRKIQEAGGLGVSGVMAVFTVLAPVLLYIYEMANPPESTPLMNNNN